jgi:quinol monooxygenase YgiN
MYAVLYQVDIKPNWEGDVDAELDQLTEAVKAVPGFVRGTWASDGKTGMSFILVENEAAAKEMAAGREIPPEASVTFRSVDIYEVMRDV